MKSIPTELQFSSLSRRLLAFLLDALIVSLPCAVANHFVPVLGGLLVLFFYYPLLEASDLKATLGKHLMGIQVVDSQGGRIALRNALIRNFLKFVSCILLFIGFIFALFTEKKQTLHDLLADTYVIYGRSERPIVDTWIASMKALFNSNTATTFYETSKLSDLERLQALKDKGALSEEEFQEEKRRILGKDSTNPPNNP